jgi:two-component system chemotaxis response regulator CheY
MGSPMSSGYRALAIDDSPHVRILMAKLLKRFGFEAVETAENGMIGLEKLESFKPDAIFLDGIMPEMDGLSVLRAVKARNTKTLVIITSSLSERDKVLQFKESGADYYLMKPFEEAKLQEMVQKVLNLLSTRQKEG